MLVVLVALLFLVGCAPVDAPMEAPIEDVEKKDAPADTITKEIFTKDRVVEPVQQLAKEPVQPLEMELSVPKKKGTLILETTLTCTATGGIEPYTFLWNGYECSGNTCEVELKDIGTIEIGCKVIDNEGTELEKEVTLEVLKEKIKVDAVIALGDSLTYGVGLANPEEENWAALYAQNFENGEIINLGKGGDTSWGVREQLERLYEQGIPTGNKIIFLWIGANDIALFVGVEQFEQNLEVLLANLTSIEDSTIVLMNVPDASTLPIADQVEQGVNQFIKELGGNIELKVKEIGKELINQYNVIVEAKANKFSVHLIDMFTYMEELEETYISGDNFHPTSEGHKKIQEKVRKEIEIGFPTKEFY